MAYKKIVISIFLAASFGAANLSLAGPIRFLSSEEKKIKPENDNVVTVRKETTEQKAVSKPKAQSISTDLHTQSIGLGLGQTFLSGDFERDGRDAITFDFFYSYAASHSFDMIANVHYSKHEHQDREVKLPGVSLGIKGKFIHYDSFSPYLMGGFGFYKPTATRNIEGNLIKSDSKITFGTHLGGGAELKLNQKFKFGVMAAFHNPFDVKQNTGTDVEGSYFKLLLTGFYTFR